METKNYVLWIVGILVIVVLGLGLSVSKDKNAMVSGEVDNNEGSMMEGGEDTTMMVPANDSNGADEMVINEDVMMKTGSYIAYSPERVSMQAEDENVVLFFRASWCPTCRSLDADIKAHLSGIPDNLTILDVDYDNSTALKQKYGVTYQHTLVEVDKDGKMIKKWSGSPTLVAFVAELNK